VRRTASPRRAQQPSRPDCGGGDDLTQLNSLRSRYGQAGNQEDVVGAVG